jgi:hypothetical protein
MDFKVFIGYAKEDDDKASYIFSCLNGIVGIQPYKAEFFKECGEDFKEKIQRELTDSHLMIVLLTENGKNSQWVNQEIGYAYALKKRRHSEYENLPNIIPISLKNVNLKGFITTDTLDFLFLDDYPSFELLMANIINQIRWRVPRGYEEGTLQLRVTCFNCVDEKNFPFVWVTKLPSQEDVTRAIQQNRCWLQYTCPQCKRPDYVDVRTFLSHKEKY